MKTIITLCFAVLVSSVGVAGQAPDAYEPPRTAAGHPDLHGVWNFSSNVSMQRPQRFGDREFMTAEEVAQLRARLAAADAASDQAVPQREGGPGGYNDFWVESAGLTDQIRTSHIVFPVTGRLPDTVAGIDIVAGGLGDDVSGDRPVRFVVGGIAKDGPEDRGLSERCIVGFNSGPPFVPSLYNNNVQIIHNEGHAVIITEMIHDTRIVPLGDRVARSLVCRSSSTGSGTCTTNGRMAMGSTSTAASVTGAGADTIDGLSLSPHPTARVSNRSTGRSRVVIRPPGQTRQNRRT